MRSAIWTKRAKGGQPRSARVLALVMLQLLATTALSPIVLAAGEPPQQAPNAANSPAVPSAEPLQNVSISGRSSPGTSQQLEDAIVEVYLRRTQQISGGMVAYIEGDDMLVPLQELMILLELAIEETPGGAAGWYLSEDKRFVLDLKAGQVQSDGKRFALKPSEAKRIENKLFVSAKSLSEWLPLSFRGDLRAQQLQVNPRVALPMEERAARQNNKKYGSIHQFRSELPKHETPYALGQIPAIEADLAAGFSSGRRSDRNGRGDDRGISSLYTGGTIRAFGDLAYMNGEGFVTGNGNRIYDARLRLGRVDPDGGLLGPLDATSYSIGDVGSTAIPLVSHGLYGRGVNVSSRPQGYLAEFDRITIEDSVPVGHEVELYRNGILMASSGPSSTGRYKFDNVPLLRGENEIRLEFYGPQGQRRTETKQYFVGAQQVPVGKFNYDFTLNEVGRSVFGFTNWVRDNRQYDNTSVGGAARFDYGLFRNLSITGGFAAAPLPTRTRETTGDDYRYYATLGARTMIGDYSLGVDGAMDDKGGVAAGVSAQTAVKGWTVSGRHEQFMNNFASDVSLGTAYADRSYAYRTSNTAIRADTYFGQLWSGQLNVNFGVIGNYTTFDTIADSWRAGVTTGATMGRFSVANDIYYGGALSSGNQGVLGTARFNVRVFDGISVRFSTDYDLRDKAEVQGFSAGLTAPLPYDVTFGIGYAQRFDIYRVQPNSESYFASLRRRFAWAEVGLLASYNKYDQFDRSSQFDQRSYDDEYRAVMTVSFSTFTDPSTLGTFVSSDRIARQGAIRPVAFHDQNQNGVRDPGEPAVEGVRIAHMAQRDPYVTGGPRSAPMGPVGAGNWTDVAVDRTGMPDPTMSPGSPGRAVLPRPGVVSNLELPLIAKAGVDGRVDLRIGKDLRALPNVKIQVVRRDTSGSETVVKEAHTEFDGAFSLADVPVGAYTLRVDPEQARQIGARGPVEKPIKLAADTGVLDGVALQIERSPATSTVPSPPASRKSPKSEWTTSATTGSAWATQVCATAKTGEKC